MPPTRGGATPQSVTDVEVSLVSDFQLIDDVRVSVCVCAYVRAYVVCVCACVRVVY